MLDVFRGGLLWRLAPLPAVLIGLSVVAAAVSPSAAARVAYSIDDVCSPQADPCIVSEEVTVAAGSLLDAKQRTLRIEGGGLLDFEAGGGEVLCGRLEVETAGVAIRVRGGQGSGGLASPVFFTVFRACSGSPVSACLLDSECSGIGAGSCSVGDGRAEIHGDIQGRAEDPAGFVLRSAGDLALYGDASLAGTRTVSDRRPDGTGVDPGFRSGGGGRRRFGWWRWERRFDRGPRRRGCSDSRSPGRQGR